MDGYGYVVIDILVDDGFFVVLAQVFIAVDKIIFIYSVVPYIYGFTCVMVFHDTFLNYLVSYKVVYSMNVVNLMELSSMDDIVGYYHVLSSSVSSTSSAYKMRYCLISRILL